MIQTLAVSGYRSLRNLVLPLAPLTVITGANGTGKSSLYRSLRLLADVAQGRAISSLAAEGGLKSTIWAGPKKLSHAMKTGEQPITGTRRTERIALKLGFLMTMVMPWTWACRRKSQPFQTIRRSRLKPSGSEKS